MSIVYLSGPIVGLRYGTAKDWRDTAGNFLKGIGAQPLCPLRGKEYLDHGRPIDRDDDHWMSTPDAIIGRDRFDVESCSVMLAYLKGAEKVSIGTMVEYGWANAYHKPIVTVIESTDNEFNNPHHNHPMVHGLSTYVVHSLDEALVALRHLLNK